MLGVAMIWIVGTILVRGVSALSLEIFIEPTQGNGGGLLNAIEGTAVLALGTLILAVPARRCRRNLCCRVPVQPLGQDDPVLLRHVGRGALDRAWLRRLHYPEGKAAVVANMGSTVIRGQVGGRGFSQMRASQYPEI